MPNFKGDLTEVSAWMSDYIPLFYMDIITYSCHNPDAAGIANLCW